MPTLARASPDRELERMIRLYLKAETDIINEIGRLRSRRLVDYHAVAALERVQAILRQLEADDWEYVPRLVESQFYVRRPEARAVPGETVEKHKAGYFNAQTLTGTQTDIVQKLTMNLMGQLTDAHMTVLAGLQSALLGRTEPDIYRRVGLEQVAAQQAAGRSINQSVPAFVDALRREGVTAFTDKSGRNWSLHTYATMVSRSTSRQAEILSVVTADPEQDLYQISAHGTTCALCAPYEGRVYSLSGKDPDFPPLSDAFGKVDPDGADDLTNSWLNIHPNCLVGGGFVLAEGVMAHSCREYNGLVIHLVTASGNEITVTPNHPILTLRGFVPAGSLHERDKVIEATGEYAAFLRKTPNDIYIPTRVEEIPHAVIKPGGSTSVRVKGTAVQFHGDGIPNSKVDIVFSDRFGVNVRNALRCKPIRKPRFPSAHLGRMRFFAFSSSLQVLKRSRHSLNRFMSCFGFIRRIKRISVQAKKFSNISLRSSAGICDFSKCHSLFMQSQKPLKFFRVGCNILWRNIQKLFGVAFWVRNESVVDAGAFDGLRSYSEMLCDLSVSEPLTAQRLQSLFGDGVLVISELVHVSTSQYHGKVYNLQTEFGFYTYNNIVTHNCLHVLTPWTPAGRSPEELERIKRFSSPKTNPYSRDPRTKAQIDAYRAKEKGRAKWLREYRQWEKYRTTLGDKVPKTFETFQRHKLAGDEKYQGWVKAYREAGSASAVSFRGAGNAIEPGGESVRKLLGTVDLNDTTAVEQLKDAFCKQYASSPVENMMVITKTGEVHFMTDNNPSRVDCSYLGDKLVGSYNIHTHPPDTTQYSFSTDADIPAAFTDGTSIMEAVDFKYRYQFVVPKEITFEQWESVCVAVSEERNIIMTDRGYGFEDYEENIQHVIIDETCRRLGLKCYHRETRK